MSVRLVLPDFPVSPRDLRRCRDSLALEFGPGTITLAAAAADLPLAAAHGEAVEIYDQDVAARLSDGIAFIEDARPGRASALQSLRSRPVYRFSFAGRASRAQLLPVDTRFNRERPVLSANLFHRLGPDHSDTTIFFPHGYIHRQFGTGPIDEFGHRLCPPPVLPGRTPSQCVVAVFGGSAAWSVECLPHESFPVLLQTELNRRAAAAGAEFRIAVRNFGHHGNVVVNEMQKFVTFCLEASPDFVIAHDGYNDFVYGLLSDPDLLGKHHLTYQEVMEDWSPRLHDGWDASARRTPQERFKVRNSIEAIMRAYLVRKRQFERLCTALGCHFVWGLQPYLHSKVQLSHGERRYIEARRSDEQEIQRLFYQHVPILYDAFVTRSAWRRIANRVDCHLAFEDVPDDIEHFVDFVHCTPEGDAVIAQCYVDYIARHLFPEYPS